MPKGSTLPHSFRGFHAILTFADQALYSDAQQVQITGDAFQTGSVCIIMATKSLAPHQRRASVSKEDFDEVA
ncbi:MAG: hypothetical protein LZF86_110191 [Nitrospira sp.]|nr:MAG: hypothetical protein LZF86_110191 [Nitrospira sp.]